MTKDIRVPRLTFNVLKVKVCLSAGAVTQSFIIKIPNSFTTHGRGARVDVAGVYRLNGLYRVICFRLLIRLI